MIPHIITSWRSSSPHVIQAHPLNVIVYTKSNFYHDYVYKLHACVINNYISILYRTTVHLLINIQPCLTEGLDKCFDSSQFAAEFIVAAIQRKQWTTPLPVRDVSCKYSVKKHHRYFVFCFQTMNKCKC